MVQMPLRKRHQLQVRSVLRAVDRSCGSVVEALGFRTSLVDALGGCETTVGPTPTTRLTVADALQNAKDLPEEVSSVAHRDIAGPRFVAQGDGPRISDVLQISLRAHGRHTEGTWRPAVRWELQRPS